jgi:hypothetical protein
MKFQETDYRNFLLSLNGEFKFFPPSLGDGPPKGRTIYLRHDIDGHPENSVAMSLIEKDMGIKSTYFVLNTATYFENDLSKELDIIKSGGHEIGWHNSALYTWVVEGETKPLREYIETPLKILRERYGCRIRGSAAHCVKVPYIDVFRNYQIWEWAWMVPPTIDFEKFNMLEFGLDYEAYATLRGIYLCDSANKWNRNPGETIALFNSTENITMQLLIHPQWWSI